MVGKDTATPQSEGHPPRPGGVTTGVSPSRCHHRSVTQPVSPRECHPASVTQPVSPWECHPAGVTTGVSPSQQHPRHPGGRGGGKKKPLPSFLPSVVPEGRSSAGPRRGGDTWEQGAASPLGDFQGQGHPPASPGHPSSPRSLRRQSPGVIPRCKHRVPPLFPGTSPLQDCTKSFVHKDFWTLCRVTKQLSPWGHGWCVLQPVAVPVAERGLRELYDRGTGFIEELWSPAQQPLGLGESLCQLFLPLNKLGVALTL